MRIVFVINSLIYGGAETQVIAMSKELVRRGHAVSIYTLFDDNPRARELDGSGVALVVDRKRSKLDIRLIRRLRRYCLSQGTDIVQGYLYDGDLYARLAMVGTGIPVLNSERNDSYSQNRLQSVGLVLTRHLAAGVVANSHAGAAFAQRLFRFPGEDVHVVWNGLDLAAIDRRLAAREPGIVRQLFGKEQGLKIACLVGSIKPQKDYLLALRCAQRLTNEHPAWRVVFVGDQLRDTGGYKSEVMREFERLGDAGRIRFLGLRPDALEVIGDCDVLFSSSAHEGFPNVVLEAMAAGIPVASTAYSDIRRILPFSWQIAAQRTSEELAEIIVRADRERQAISAAQRRWVEVNGTVRACGDTLEAVFRHYVGAQPSDKTSLLDLGDCK